MGAKHCVKLEGDSRLSLSLEVDGPNATAHAQTHIDTRTDTRIGNGHI